MVLGEALPAAGLSLGSGDDPLASLAFQGEVPRGTWTAIFAQIPALPLGALWSY